MRSLERVNIRTNERTYVRTYSHTYVRDKPYIPSTTLLREGIINKKNMRLPKLEPRMHRFKVHRVFHYAMEAKSNEPIKIINLC